MFNAQNGSHRRSIAGEPCSGRFTSWHQKQEARQPLPLLSAEGRHNRIRFLSAAEEIRCEMFILAKYASISRVEIAVNTGMRRKESMCASTGPCVDFLHEHLFVPQSKTGRPIRQFEPEALAPSRRFTSGKAKARSSRPSVALSGAEGRTSLVRNAVISEVETSLHCCAHVPTVGHAGVDLRTVADLMGHATSRMTMRYAIWHRP